MRLRVLLAVALTSLVLSATAAACAEAHKPPSWNLVTRAISIAEHYWGMPPACNLTMDASTVQPTIVEAGPDDVAVSSGGVFAQAWTDVQACTVTINSEEWPSWESERQPFQWFCDIVTHELGHLPPLNHADDGQVDTESIEYPRISPGTPNYDSVPGCAKFSITSKEAE